MFVKHLKKYDVLPQDASFELDGKDHNNIYFDTFIKRAMDHGVLPTIDTADSKSLEACNWYFESFVKTSVENGLLQKIDYNKATHEAKDFDAYFETFVSHSLQNSGQKKTDFTKDEMLDTTTVYFDVFAKNYKPESKKKTSSPAKLDATAGQNIYVDAFLTKHASL